MKKEISEAQIIPPFYGVAYHDYRKNMTICYPLVINLIVILWRDTIYWARNPKGSK